MSTRQEVIWTCDRCGHTTAQSSSTGAPEQPPRWSALYMIVPPLMSPMDSRERPEQICPDCSEAFADWFMAGRS